MANEIRDSLLGPGSGRVADLGPPVKAPFLFVSFLGVRGMVHVKMRSYTLVSTVDDDDDAAAAAAAADDDDDDDDDDDFFCHFSMDQLAGSLWRPRDFGWHPDTSGSNGAPGLWVTVVVSNMAQLKLMAQAVHLAKTQRSFVA